MPLTLTILGPEVFNDETQEFTTQGDVTIVLEHSLVSLAKWEAIWEKPFLDDSDKTPEETLSYVQQMCLGDFPEEILQNFSEDNVLSINKYLDAKMTATWFNDTKVTPKRGSEAVTAEIIYYWMISLNIPLECETWHLNRLFTLIKVCNQKNAPPKKMTPNEIAARNRALNEKRRAQMKTNG